MTELTDEQEFLQRSLADLEAEHDAGDIDEADYETLKRRYTARSAAVEREQVVPVAAGSGAGRSFKVPITVAVIAVVAVLAGWVVMAAAGDRTPGQNITGSVPGATAPAAAASTVGARLEQARQLIQNQKAVDAIKLYDAILKDDPKQPEALAYRGWLLHLAGVDPQALESVTKAVQSDPAYPDAHFFRGELLCTYSHDQAGAVAEFQQFLATDPSPDLASMVTDRLNKAKAGACTDQKLNFGSPPPGAATPTTPAP